MNIGKFTGKTKEEALKKAKEQLGEGAVIMNEKTVKAKGFLRFFKKSTYEITAAVEDSPAVAVPKKSPQKAASAYAEAQSPAENKTANAGVAFSGENVEDDSSKEELKKRIDELQNMLESQLKADKEKKEVQDEVLDNKESDRNVKDNTPLIKLIYNALINNEVDERYANAFMSEIEKTLKSSSELDVVLPNVYQKLVLKFGQPKPISLSSRKPKVVFFIGPTGVGKTTTIAKIASRFRVEMDKKVALVTSDTYRIAATDQLRTYANYLDIPLYIVYGPDELGMAVDNYIDYDLILVDTAGFSHKNKEQKEELRDLLDGITDKVETEIFLVLSATTKYKDLLKIVATYAQFTDYKLIFTKLDETDCYGNLLNIKLHTGADVSYLTTGQNVPQDIEVFNAQKIVKQLLGGR
ncbi:MAG: flagellar biosynthesis protein FlhF [Eubacterium sp.]|nr:flagellar biosynthesis protein FlhF [Eubacterium sp.]